MLCTSLALPAVEGWDLCHMDVKRRIFKQMTYRIIIYEATDRLQRWY